MKYELSLANLKDLVWILEIAEGIFHERSEREWETRAKRYKEIFQCRAELLEKKANEREPPFGFKMHADQHAVLAAMEAASGDKFNRSAFIRKAIDEKLERDLDPALLEELGWIKSF